MILRLPLAVVVLLPAAGAAQVAQVPAAAVVRHIADDLRRTANLPGLSVAVMQRGRLVFAEGFGHADVERRLPVTPATQFRTASVAKVITATALARLVEAGRLDLDAPVQRYVPSFPDKGGRITPRRLAGHLSGLPHYSDADRVEDRVYASVTDALSVFAHVPPAAPPGERYHYSTHGYTLLSAAVEGAAGVPFLEYLARGVLQPLGMRATGPERQGAPPPAAATLYTLASAGPAPVERPEDVSYKWGGGGLVSTPSDLVRLADAYTSGFLRPETVAAMFASQRDASGAATGVGIGWRGSWDMDGRRVFEHAGSMQGARSVVCLFLDERVAVAVMANAEWSSGIEETAHLLALPYLAPPAPRPQPAGTFDVAATSVNGRNVATAWTGTMTLRAGGGALALATAAGERQVYPLVYLGREDLYALVRPDGVYHLTLAARGDSVTGRATGYGSPMARPPASNPPFFTLRARRAGRPAAARP